jgi:hypothetical protein
MASHTAGDGDVLENVETLVTVKSPWEKLSSLRWPYQGWQRHDKKWTEESRKMKQQSRGGREKRKIRN